MAAHSKLKIPAGVVSQTLGDEAVLLNLKTGMYWGLNRTGAVIWNEISRHGDVQKTLAALCDRYDASEEHLAAALEELLEQLLKEELLVSDGATPHVRSSSRD